MPLLGCAVGGALAAALFFYVKDDIERDARLRFERQAADAKHIIERRLHSYVSVTYGLKALFAARDTVDRAQFHRYVTSLDLARNYPGFEVLNYARQVRAEETRQLEEEMRTEYPDFRIRPPGKRAEQHVLVYLEPMQSNRFALGFDIISNAPQAKVVALHRDSGELFSSGRLLNVGSEGSVGLAMRLAVYRNGAPLDSIEQRRAAFIGSVGAGYNVRKLMAGVLDDTRMTSMRYRLYDAGPLAEGGPAGPLSLLFDSAQNAPGTPKDDFMLPGEEQPFETVLPLTLAQRNWQLHFSSPRSAFIEGADRWLPWVTLAGGVLGALLLYGVLYAFASARERAVRLAEHITRELRESETNLAHAQALARLGSWTLELPGGEMTWSAETYRLLGFEDGRAEPGLQSFLAWFSAPDRAAFGEAVIRCAASGTPCALEFELRVLGHEARWAHFVLQPLARNGATRLHGTIMDITERKRALELQRTNAAQIRDLLRRLVSVQEDERRRYSANLHDLVGQSLTVIGIGLETLRRRLPPQRTTGEERAFDEMGEMLKETMVSVREVMSDLRPPLLDDYGLYAALEWHARQLAARTGLAVSLGGQALEPRAPAEVEMALFRIAQEALTNAVKHARASQVELRLVREAGRVRLVVQDDGSGLPGSAANDAAAPGWGMAVMRERAVAVGGEMRIERAERGTRIVVEVGGA